MAYSTGSFGFSYMLTPIVKRLMIANVVVFFLTLLIGQDFVFEWFAFQPTRIFFRPWGPITYMFLHGSFMHLASPARSKKTRSGRWLQIFEYTCQTNRNFDPRASA